jgi:RNA polymerase sigma factor (sigma-70 family)
VTDSSGSTDSSGDSSAEYRADTALVRACLDGDQLAWATLVERYGRLVYSVARRCGLGSDDADDVFQVVFTNLFRRLGGLRDEARLSSWLITTAYRESWRTARANRPHDDLADVADRVADLGSPPVELVVQIEREQVVREGMARLEPRCRDLLTALFLDADAPSYETIAQRFGMAIGSIGPTRARCFQKLEAILSSLGLDRES